MPVAGNPQLNIRLEPALMSKVKARAEELGLRPQEWVRNLVKAELGELVAVSYQPVSSGVAGVISATELESFREELRERLSEEVSRLEERVSTWENLTLEQLRVLNQEMSELKKSEPGEVVPLHHRQ